VTETDERSLRRAAEAGDLEAAFDLGVLLRESGRFDEAAYWWRHVADRGSSDAAWNLGLLLNERGDLIGAERWFRQAAEAGDLEAAVSLGLLLQAQGREDEAVAWWRQAAESGHGQAAPIAAFGLGVYFSNREEPDRAEAERWWRLAGEAGFAPAAFNLAWLLLQRGDQEVEWWLYEAAGSDEADIASKAQKLIEDSEFQELTWGWDISFGPLTAPVEPTDPHAITVFKAGFKNFEEGRFSEALGCFEEAQRLFHKAGDQNSAIGCDGMIGYVLFELGQYESGFARLESAAAHFETYGSAREATLWDASTAHSLSRLGRHHEALRRWQMARAYFDAKALGQVVAGCDQNIAGVLGSLGWYEAALARARAARSGFELVGEPKAVRDEAGRPHVEVVDVTKELGFCDHTIAVCLSRLDRHGDALESMEQARASFVTAKLWNDVTDCDAYLGVILNDLGLRDEALEALGRARLSYEDRHLSLQLAYCDHNRAAILMDMDRLDEALTAALQAVVRYDTSRYMLRHSQHRISWVAQHKKSYALTLDLAQRLAKPKLVAELVEGARIQGLPSSAARDRQSQQVLNAPVVQAAEEHALSSNFDTADVSQSIAISAAGLTPLTPPPNLFLFENSRSELAALVPTGRWEKRAYLAHAARAAAGETWWWWGTWATGEWLHWSLIGHDGTVEAGAVALSELTEPLKRLAAALPICREGETRDQATARANSGALTNREMEAALARDLGTILLPLPLRERLLAADPTKPLSLVIAPAPLLGQVPFALLGLDNGSDARSMTSSPDVHSSVGSSVDRDVNLCIPRLIERAVLRLGASVPLLEMIAARGRTTRSFDKVATVLDPGGQKLVHDTDLALWGLELKAPWMQDVLSRPEHLQILTDSKFFRDVVAKEATKQAFGEMLRNRNADVLAYFGHVDTRSLDAPASAHLPLNDGELAAAELLYQPESYPIPPRVALLGCSSSGAHSPEWLTLAPAVLWAGARVVVVTNWNIPMWTTPELFIATVKMFNTIVGILRDPGDSASRIQEMFCENLQRWRTGENVDPPLLWASFSLVGLCESPDDTNQFVNI
jgi:TPR repeat protein